jgi:hypothetical protein
MYARRPADHSSGADQNAVNAAARADTAVDGNDSASETTDALAHRPADDFEASTLTAADLDVLRELARRNGTYFGPGYPGPAHDSAGAAGASASSSPWTGRLAFDALHRVKNGVVFVDSVSGATVPTDPRPDDGLRGATLTIDGDFAADAGGFRGWIVVNGTVQMRGTSAVRGLLYARQSLTIESGGRSVEVAGQIIGAGAGDADGTIIDAGEHGQVRVHFDCGAIRDAPGLSTGWTLKSGTYREVSD